jgi:hypothetical protein
MDMHVPHIPVVRPVRGAAAQTAPAQVPQFAYRPVRRSAPMFHIQHLELAPEGWRLCVETIAEGLAEVIGEHAYCLNCGGVLEGAQGHDVTCLTMVARRILANEPLLHAQHKAAGAQEPKFPGLDIDAAHARGKDER